MATAEALRQQIAQTQGRLEERKARSQELIQDIAEASARLGKLLLHATFIDTLVCRDLIKTDGYASLTTDCCF